MPGSSHICGLMACRYSRVLDQNKPRSLTFDAHIVVGFDDNNDTRTCCAVLHHFRAAWEPEPIDNAIYEVAGKIASIPPDYNVGINHKVNAYDFIIDAEKVLPPSFFTPFHLRPPPPLPHCLSHFLSARWLSSLRMSRTLSNFLLLKSPASLGTSSL